MKTFNVCLVAVGFLLGCAPVADDEEVEIATDEAALTTPTQLTIDHAGLVSSYSACLHTEMDVGVGTFPVVTSVPITVKAGDVLIAKGSLHGSEDQLNTTHSMSTWLTCNGAVISATKTKDLRRSAGNHHASMRVDGHCSFSAAGTANVVLMAKSAGPDMIFESTTDGTCLQVEQYRPNAGIGATKVLSAAHKTGTFEYGVNDSYDFIEDQSVTLPADLPAGSQLYAAAQAEAEVDPYHTDTGAMSGFRLCDDLSASPCADSGTNNVATTSENVLLGLHVLSQDLGYFDPYAKPSMRIHSSIYSADASGTDEGGPGGTGLIDLSSGSALQVLLLGSSGFPLRELLTAASSGSFTIPVNATATLNSASLTTTSASILRVVAHVQTNGPPSNARDCKLHSEIWKGGARVAYSVATARYVSAPYYQAAIRNEAFYSLAAGTYELREIIYCNSSTGSALTGVASGTQLLVDVFGGT